MGKKSNAGVVEVKPAVALIGTASGGNHVLVYLILEWQMGPTSFGLLCLVKSGSYMRDDHQRKTYEELVKGFADNYPGDTPPGPFTVSFNLPGPVDSRWVDPRSHPGGILEVLILKSKKPLVPPRNHWFIANA